MKTLLLLSAIFAVSYAEGKPSVPAEYASMDCPTGDITLSLKPDGAYTLELKHWSDTEQRHTHSEALSGKWKSKSDTLQLLGKVKLTYNCMIPEAC